MVLVMIPKVKQEIFGTLTQICNPQCILASNTSTINFDLITANLPPAAKGNTRSWIPLSYHINPFNWLIN
jgi:3-hydroxyacyl-CoA dehydrogenase